MAGGEVRTNLIIGAKVQGFSEAQETIGKVNQKVKENAKAQSESYRDAEKRLAALTASSGELLKALEKGAKTSSLEDVMKIAKTVKGVEKIQKQIDKLKASMSGATSEGAKAMVDDLTGVHKAAEKASTAMDRLQTKHGNKRHGGGGGHGHGYGRGGGSLGSGGGRHEVAHHPFTQGFLEGSISGKLSRIIESDKPGQMMRQGAGIIAGEGLREGAGGLASMPFRGEAGMVRAMESLPLVGGPLSAVTERVLQQSQQAIAFRRQESQLSPYLGGVGMAHGGAMDANYARAYGERGIGDESIPGLLSAARTRGQDEFDPHAVGKGTGGIRASVDMMNEAQRMRQSDIDTKAQEVAKTLGGDVNDDDVHNHALRLLGIKGYRHKGISKTIDAMEPVGESYINKAAAPYRAQAGEESASAAQTAIDAQRAEARAKVREQTLNPIQEAGEKYGGMDLGETQQLMARMAMTGGGTARDIQSQGMVGLGIAAQSAYGIGAETSGAFLQAGRVGGVVGSGLGGARQKGRNGGDLETKAISDALKMGLEGSEITQYLQSMANDITSWKQTGIPLAEDSMGKLGASMASMGGVGGQRGSIMAQSAIHAVQGMAESGPTDAYSALAFRDIGGYEGGDLSSYMKARNKMERGDFSPEEMNKFAKTLNTAGRAGGTGANADAGGQLALIGGLRDKLGVHLSGPEAELYQKQLEGRLTPDEEKQIGALQRKMSGQKGTDKGGIMARGAAATGSVNEEEARKRNEQRESGDSLIGTVQSMDKVLQDTSDVFSKSLAPSLNTFSRAVEEASGKLAMLTGGRGGHPKSAPSAGAGGHVPKKEG